MGANIGALRGVIRSITQGRGLPSAEERGTARRRRATPGAGTFLGGIQTFARGERRAGGGLFGGAAAAARQQTFGG